MRIGLVYLHYTSWPKFEWVHAALVRMGHSIWRIQEIEELAEADKSCDLILFEHREPGPGRKQIVKLSNHHRALWVQWWFDLFIEQGHQDLIPLYGDLARAMDYVLVKERSSLPKYRELGINAFWSDQGCPGTLRYEAPIDPPAFDVCLFGSRNPQYVDRISDVRALLAAGFSVLWAGDGTDYVLGAENRSWCPPDALPSLLSQAAVCLCTDLRHDIDGYWSDRLWLAAECGSAIVRRESPGLPKLPIFTYRDSAGLVTTVRDLLQRKELRQVSGKACREAALFNTYEHMISRWFHAIGFSQPCLQTAGRCLSEVSG